MATKLKMIGVELLKYGAIVAGTIIATCLFLWAGWALFIYYWLEPELRGIIKGVFAVLIVGGAIAWLKVRSVF